MTATVLPNRSIIVYGVWYPAGSQVILPPSLYDMLVRLGFVQ
jgi:hypothetical protein